jgi:MFS family permease
MRSVPGQAGLSRSDHARNLHMPDEGREIAAQGGQVAPLRHDLVEKPAADLPPIQPYSAGGFSVATSAALPGARHALLLLVLINLFNFVDRQVLAAVETEIREEFFPPKEGETVEPAEAKRLTGLLSFAFLAVYMLTAPIFGALATRMSRWLLIGIGVVVWSLASGASGLAPFFGKALGGGALPLFAWTLPTVYLVMLLTRCLVGLGEAVYGPVAPDIISDLFPVQKRGQVLAWFYAAIPFGGALGYALGALVVKYLGDWRYAFWLVVPPGILLGIWCALMREPARGLADQVKTAPQRKAAWSDYLFLLRTPSYLLNTAGMTAMTFAMGGLAFWAKGFMKYREVDDVLGMPAVMFFGLLTAVLGLAATLLGGIAGDALRRRFSGSYFLVSGAAMCVGFPLLLLMLELDFPFAWLALAGFVFCLFFNTGPTNTILANVCHPWLRARGFALNILIIHLLGDAISPFVMGGIIGNQDHYKLAFQFVSVLVLIGGLLWLWGARFLERDTELAPTRLPESGGPGA